MKLFRFLLAITMVVGITMSLTACSWDFNNPRADEWDVQIIGDSVFDLSGDIHDVLQDLSGKSYKDRSVSGAKIAAIQSQLNTALGRSTLKTIIADGGANDILQGSMDCDSDPLTQGCLDVIDYISDKMEVMLQDMYTGPPNDCIWLGYYHVKDSEAEKNEAIDYCYDFAYPAIFGSTNMDAFLVDPRNDIFPYHINSDDIHPSYAGSEILANLIWDEMVLQNVYR